jgi:hypothetical protein
MDLISQCKKRRTFGDFGSVLFPPCREDAPVSMRLDSIHPVYNISDIPVKQSKSVDGRQRGDDDLRLV